MKSKRYISAIAFVVLIVLYFFQEKNNELTPMTTKDIKIDGFNYLPTSTTNQIIKHNGYNLSYSEKHEQAEWVAYSLDKKDVVNTDRKRPYFYVDQKVKTKAAHWRSYKKSGYDRGHLCPAGDRKLTKESYNETFLTSNISPQKHDFNSGIWNRLEEQTRYWAKKYNHLFVVTGGVLKGKMKTIGKDKISVPNQFYKIVLDYTKPEIKAIAFLIPHKDSKRPLYEFVVSIDQLEQLTKIDFFPELPDDIETKLEAANNYKNWSF